VAHAYNPSYSGSREQEDLGSKPARANSSQDPISKIHHKKGEGGAGGVAQGVGPEFRPQYHKKKKKKIKREIKFECCEKRVNMAAECLLLLQFFSLLSLESLAYKLAHSWYLGIEF
jgi:hypothetical protein